MTDYIRNTLTGSLAPVNSELEKIENALESRLDRQPSSGQANQMQTNLDMNGKRIINAPAPRSSTDLARLQDLELQLNRTTTAINTVERTGRGLRNVAHRGWRDCFPQNTMLAFSSALRRGADALECDCQITSDGTVVVYHDNTLDTLTNGTGEVKDNTLAQVQSAVIDETAGTVLSETRIPTFSEFLRYAAQNDVDIFPEVKKYRTQADIDLIVADINTFNMADRAVLASFSLSDVQYIRSIDSTIGVAYLGSGTSQAFYEAAVDAVAALGGRGYIIWDNQALLSTPAIITYAFSKGVEVAAYTVDNNATAKALVALGVKDIITDIPLVTK